MNTSYGIEDEMQQLIWLAVSLVKQLNVKHFELTLPSFRPTTSQTLPTLPVVLYGCETWTLTLI